MKAFESNHKTSSREFGAISNGQHPMKGLQCSQGVRTHLIDIATQAFLNVLPGICGKVNYRRGGKIRRETSSETITLL